MVISGAFFYAVLLFSVFPLFSSPPIFFPAVLVPVLSARVSGTEKARLHVHTAVKSLGRVDLHRLDNCADLGARRQTASPSKLCGYVRSAARSCRQFFLHGLRKTLHRWSTLLQFVRRRLARDTTLILFSGSQRLNHVAPGARDSSIATRAGNI